MDKWKEGGDNIQERLDRVFATASWCDLFIWNSVSHLHKRRSDHLPLLLNFRKHQGITTGGKKPQDRPCRFEKLWLEEERCEDVVKKAWGKCEMFDWPEKLHGCCKELKKEMRVNIKAYQLETKRIGEEIVWWQKQPPTPSNIEKLNQMISHLEDREAKEEIYWSQRSRQNWLRDGDKNTKFFHEKATQRKRRNFIPGLKDEQGIWREDKADIEAILVRYFEDMFGPQDIVDTSQVTKLVSPLMGAVDNDHLARRFTEDELLRALKQMHPTKAPGPDGMPALFFQSFWHIVGRDVVELSLKILNDGLSPACINQTFIALIPKIKSPGSTKDFRPISLCNVVYKLVSKAIANRLKDCLPHIIHESQSAFVPGRLITDNILIAFEHFHFLRKRPKSVKRGHMALKLDMSKAYDRVEWSFIKEMMLAMGFRQRFVNLIMGCIETVSYKILVNGVPSTTIRPRRGLRQGDPLSPYLFLICAEGLSALIRDREERKMIHGLRVANRAPVISHLFFADDSLLFVRATVEEAFQVREILKVYEKASGQIINVDKSEVSYGRNVSEQLKVVIQRSLGFKAVETHEKYLGLPTYVGRSKKAIFDNVQERVRKKLKGWKETHLSKGGKEILIKSVIQAIPSYVMQCFDIPISICDKLEGQCRRFWWGHDTETNGICWTKWDGLCEPKYEGGLGFRKFKNFNKALLTKQAWRLVTNPTSLLARVLKAKYFPRTDLWDARIGFQPSFTWRSILGTRDILHDGTLWRIGDGRTVQIWRDKWIPLAPNHMVTSDPILLDPSTMVADLINHDTGQWKKEILRECFSPRQMAEILAIPVGITQQKDILIWKFTKHGNFTVKSAHQRIRSREARGEGGQCSSRQMDGCWTMLWDSVAAPKVKHCVWRAIKDALPTRTNLVKKKIDIDPRCPFCGEAYEESTHLFLDCHLTGLAWRLSPLRIDTQSRAIGCFTDWLFNLLEKQDKTTRGFTLTVIWAIWSARNRWIFDGAQADPSSIISMATSFHLKFQCAQKMIDKGKETTDNRNSWVMPSPSYVKINVDAATFPGGPGGLGIVIRDTNGRVLAAKQLFMEVGWEV